MIATRFIFILGIVPLLAVAQSGKVVEHLTIKSQILGKNVAYTLYLPPDYESSRRSYPVVYLLHGYTDDDTGWIQFGEVNRYADKAIASGEIPPMIIVMPDGGVSWYINNYDGAVKYEDFFTKEFVPFIDATYRTRALKDYRGISGLSMGGFGSLLYSVKHPELFSACAALSSGVFTDEELIDMPAENYDRVFKDLYAKAGTLGKNRLTDAWYQNSVISLMQKKSPDELNKVRWYLDCGDDDFLYKGNSTLHILMRDRKIVHQFRIRDGDHTWEYWRSGITDALKFIGENFTK